MDSIYRLSKSELLEFMHANDMPKFRVSQIWDGLYKKYYQNWESFSSIPKPTQKLLSKYFSISPLKYSNEILSDDALTKKVLFSLEDGNFIEAVHLQSSNRHTICISTQSGCPVGCKFCATGAAGFFRNLSSAEIISQITYFADFLRKTDESITNIVVMGMGEPFLNYDELLQAINIFNNPDYFDIGARRITISTIGIPEKIHQFADIGKQFNLAISLHAPNDQVRQALIPLAKKVKIADILSAADYYIEKTNRRITYEYVLIKNVNSFTSHAKELAGLLKYQNCHINLIALNENEHYPGEPPSREEIEAFMKILQSNRIPTTIRNSQGSQIKAGCGQLAGVKIKPNK